MKLNSISLICLSLLLLHINFSLSKSSRKKSPPSRSNTHTSSNKDYKTNQGTSSQDSHSKQPGQTNKGGYAPQPGKPGYPGRYPKYPSGGGFHNQYPARGSPYGGGHAGYPGGYPYYNPNNKIMSPRYGGSYGLGGYGYGGGSPFSHSVQEMGFQPSYKSREYGRSGQMAAAKGAMAGMAVGYGLGRVPSPHFQVHNHQEERYYNHYVHRKYGSKSTDTNDYSRDYAYSTPPDSYETYMKSCLNRTDLLLGENRKPNIKSAAPKTAVTITTTTSVTTTNTSVTTTNTSVTTTNVVAADTVNGTNITEANSTAPSTPGSLNQPKATSATATNDDDDDTVSIVEIGYPALIKQQKVKRCVEMYMDYSEKYLKKLQGGGQGLMVGYKGFLAVVTSTILMLLNSNMLVLLH